MFFDTTASNSGEQLYLNIVFNGDSGILYFIWNVNIMHWNSLQGWISMQWKRLYLTDQALHAIFCPFMKKCHFIDQTNFDTVAESIRIVDSKDRMI